MKQTKLQNNILGKKLIPIAVIHSVDDAVPLAEALIAGGLNVIEVTLRTDAALKAMQAIKQSVPEMMVGAGTILDHKLIPQLMDIGVSFGISPGLNPLVIESAKKHNLPDRSKALRCLITFAMEQTEQEASIFTEIRCTSC